MNDLFNNYDSETDERLDKKFSYNYQVIKNVYPQVSELPEDEVRKIIRKYYDATGTHEESMQAVMDYIRQKEPEWKRLYFRDEALDNGSRIQPMTERQKKEAEALARQIRPQIPNMFTDYLAENIADMVYGADRAMSGYSLGGYDWLKRKSGLGIDNEEYLKMKEYNEGTNKAAGISGMISELGGGLKGLSTIIYNGAKSGAKMAGRYVPQGLKRSSFINEMPAMIGSGALGSGIYSTFQNDFSDWDEVGKEMGYGAGMSAATYPFLRGGSKAAGYTNHWLASKPNGSYKKYMSRHAADEVMDFTPTREQIAAIKPESTYNPNIKYTREDADNILRERVNRQGLDIYNDKNSYIPDAIEKRLGIQHLIGNDRTPFIRTLNNTMNSPDIQFSSGGRNFVAKMYKNADTDKNFMDYIITENGDIVTKYPATVRRIANQIKRSAQNMSLSGRVPLTYARETYSLANRTNNNIPFRGVVVNPGLANISTIYEGLTAYQRRILEKAVAEGLSKSVQKAGSLESMDKIRQEINNMLKKKYSREGVGLRPVSPAVFLLTVNRSLSKERF